MWQNFLKQSLEIFQQLQQPELWWQLLCLALALGFASFSQYRVNQQWAKHPHLRTGFRRLLFSGGRRLIWAVSALLILLPAKLLLHLLQLPDHLLQLSIAIFGALAFIRLGVYLLRKAFGGNPLLKSTENVLAGAIWLAVMLYLLGWLPATLALMDDIGVTVGTTYISLLSTTKLVTVVILTFTIALWLAEFLNKQLRRMTHISPSLQVGFAKFIKFTLVALAFVLALNAVGFDLSSLAVFGGALGVGVGFGLQRIASNFISGFILVFDRSIKPGDVVTVGDNFGTVEQLHARYVVVRNRDGVDTLIPNENLITSEVINWSYADRNVRVLIKVQISYDDDPKTAMAILLECAKASTRVLQDPIPVVQLIDFADSGVELHLKVWIADPENGTDPVRSEINLAIWDGFKAAGITIPYPQRDLHLKSALPLQVNMPTAS
jgi:small-conductance mechanosensitive channel